MGLIATQSAFIVQYGAPKKGKTTDCLLSFPRAVWIAAPGALKPSLGVAGYEPPDADQHNVEDILAATEIIQRLPAGKYDALVVDDLTLLVDRTVTLLSKRGVSGYDLWGAIHTRLLALREAGRRSGVHVVLNAHESPPHMDSGTLYPGSLALPGKTLPYKIPAAADVVLHAESAPDGTIVHGWKVLYRCDPTSSTWLTGDRHNVIPNPAPMNLGEILRLIGEVNQNPRFGPRRLAGLEWQEAIVEKASRAIQAVLADDNAVGGLLKQTFDHVTAKFKADERHAIWTVRDALDRAVLRNALSGHRRKHYGF
jgi:hypothetical protein